MSNNDNVQKENDGSMRAPRTVGAGLFMILVGLFALYHSWGLTTGTTRQLGPGMIPQSLSVLLAICGGLLIVEGFVTRGEKLEAWKIRGPLFILGAVVIFGLVIKPLGLLLAAPIAMGIGGLASSETRPREIAIFAVVMTAFCLGLFKYALSLPIPLAPWLIGY